MGEQLTASAGAPIDEADLWAQVDWDLARREVRRLQMRIAKAVKEGRWRKVKVLQYLLSRSFVKIRSNHPLKNQRVSGSRKRRSRG